MNSLGQENDLIIDPIQNACYRLNGDKKIEPLALDSHYYGRIIVKAEIDTIRVCLKNPLIVFAKLKSNIDPNDSIEIRLNMKQGNYSFLESNMPQICNSVTKLQLERINKGNCVFSSYFMIPIKIDLKE